MVHYEVNSGDEDIIWIIRKRAQENLNILV